MKTIWKYVLSSTDWQIIEVPKIHKVLSAQSQYNQVCLWVEVDDSSPKSSTIGVFIAVTGNEVLKQDIKFLDTVQLYDGTLVLHVYTQEGK